MENKDNKDIKIEELTDEQLSEVAGGTSDQEYVSFSRCVKARGYENCCRDTKSFVKMTELRQECEDNDIVFSTPY